MSLRVKLLLAQAPLAVALVVVCILSVVMISSLGSHSQTILKDNYRSVLAIQRMQEALERLEDSASLVVLAALPNEEKQKVAAYRQQFENELKVQEGNITEYGEGEATQRLRTLWTSYQEQFDQLMRMKDPEEARRFYFTTLEPTFHEVKTTAETILAMNQDAMVRKSDAVRRTAERLNTLTVVAALGVLLLGLFLSATFTRRLLRPLAELSQATRRIGQGDFTARAQVRGTDELAQLAPDFNALASHSSEYRNSSRGDLLQVQQAAQAAIDSLPDPVVVFGVAGDVRNVNRAAEALLGLVLESNTTAPLQAVDPAVRAVLERLCTHVLSGKGPYTPKGLEDAVQIPAREGDRYLLPRATPVYEEQGGIVGATVLLQDITRL